jgi:hypothetical protein
LFWLESLLLPDRRARCCIAFVIFTFFIVLSDDRNGTLNQC